MRICIFTPTFLPNIGGVELAVHYVASNLTALGHEVVVVTFWSRGRRGEPNTNSYTVRSIVPGVSRLGGRLAFIGEYSIVFALAALWVRWRYNVLHVHLAYPGGYAAALLKRLVKAPVVVTCHAADIQVVPELNYGLRLKPGLEAKIKYGLQRADFVTAVSESVASDIRALCPNVRALKVVPNGVASERFTVKPFSIRQELGLPPHAKLILAVGRNHPKKGYATLVEAISLLSKRHTDFRCVIVGRDTETLRPAIREMGLEEVILLPGQFPPCGLDALQPDSIPPDELVGLYLESDVFVSPSLIEGFALVIPEAMMAGLPVVATDVPGNRDIVVDGVNGLLVPPADAQALASSLELILMDGTIGERMSTAARETATRYDWRRIAESYLSVYRAARNQGSRPRVARP